MKGTPISAFFRFWISGRQSWFWFTIWVRPGEDAVLEASTWHPHNDNCCPSGKEDSDKSQVSLFQLHIWGLEWPSGGSGSRGPTVIKACTRLCLLPGPHTPSFEKWGYGGNVDPWYHYQCRLCLSESAASAPTVYCSLWSCRNLLMSVLASYNGALERAWYFLFPNAQWMKVLWEKNWENYHWMYCCYVVESFFIAPSITQACSHTIIRYTAPCIFLPSTYYGAFLGPDGKDSAYNAEDLSLIWEVPLEKEMATHSRILAWEIPWTEKPGGLQSMGSKSWIQLRE